NYQQGALKREERVTARERKMEPSISSLTFKGTIPEAIDEAKRKKGLILVYVSGKDAESVYLEQSTWMDTNVAVTIPKYCILLHLVQGSVDASQFSAIYPQRSIPSISAIGYDGVKLWNHEGYISSENLVTNIEKAWMSIHIQETTATFFAAALASKKSEESCPSSSNVATTDEVISSNCNSQSSAVTKPQQGSDLKESLSCESNASSSQVVGAKEFESGLNEEIASSTEIAMIDAGKSEAVPEALSIGDECPSQQAVNLNDNVPVSPPESFQITANDVEKTVQTEKNDATDNNIKVNKSNDVHLNIRLPAGLSIQEKFLVTDTLRLVKDYVGKNHGGIDSYDLAIPYPRKIFDDQDLSKPLSDLGLFDRHTLIVVPRSRGNSSSRGLTNSDVDTDPSTSNVGGYFGYVKKLLSYINPLKYLGGGTYRSSPGQGSSGAWQYSPILTPQNQVPNASNNKKPVPSKSASNIHTLKHDEDEGQSKDRNTFWNGNSTEYGGDNNDHK
ncbi:hypothetical protein GIB67_008378, partial [Kingdonia uniflora]